MATHLRAEFRRMGAIQRATVRNLDAALDKYGFHAARTHVAQPLQKTSAIKVPALIQSSFLAYRKLRWYVADSLPAALARLP